MSYTSLSAVPWKHFTGTGVFKCLISIIISLKCNLRKIRASYWQLYGSVCPAEGCQGPSSFLNNHRTKKALHNCQYSYPTHRQGHHWLRYSICFWTPRTYFRFLKCWYLGLCSNGISQQFQIRQTFCRLFKVWIKLQTRNIWVFMDIGIQAIPYNVNRYPFFVCLIAFLK